MHKRFISIFLVITLVLSIFSLPTSAEEHQHTFENKREFDLTNLPDGYRIPFTIYEAPCSGGCGYSEFSWDVFGVSGKFIDKTGTSGVEVYKHWKEWFESVYGKNATPEKLDTANGGANIPAAGGRNPKGYGNEGKANVTSNGKSLLWVEPYGVSASQIIGFSQKTPENLILGRSASGTNFLSSNVSALYYFTAPVSGLYYVGSDGSPYDAGSFDFFWDNWIVRDLVYTYSNTYQYTITLNKGDTCYFSFFKDSGGARGRTYKYYLNNIPIYIDSLGDSSITTVNNITITNNNYSQTWNGNIYVDTSNNLTYIYPEYTTINENNETVTNISNNPIIYNNETQQYYTYDSTTNNYYYITYGDTSATPTPSPSPEPTPTPSPGTDPTPTPGGGSGGGDGGNGGSGSGSSGSSWWEKLLDNLGSAIVDGLLGAISAVLKLIFKLFSTILGWIIWLTSQVLTLFPFLPPGLGALLIGGVVVCFVIGIIKFIRG